MNVIIESEIAESSGGYENVRQLGVTNYLWRWFVGHPAKQNGKSDRTTVVTVGIHVRKDLLVKQGWGNI
jgi:hypothetical protein